MTEEKRFLVDVGLKNLPFPMKVLSKTNPDGQQTVANISVNARIMHEFEARWIDAFIQILHQHRERIGTKTLRANIADYTTKLSASHVNIDFDYPFFIEKITPKSGEKCLVRYLCRYSVRTPSVRGQTDVIFKMEVPCLTTYPSSKAKKEKGLFGQLSIMDIEIDPKTEIFPEDIVDIVDRHAISPVYSFLTDEDQDYIIDKMHSQDKSSVIVVDEIKDELAHNHDVNWYSIRAANFGMLHTYSTVIGTEKSMWVPFSGYEE
ncbi:MAG: GTP cyclohydrolase, FolE2/MptA family [Phycisphaerae bacterium]|nr:GTP cyclohydrolase, FolE2/MptA family [Phycisphaerae bacterium]